MFCKEGQELGVPKSFGIFAQSDLNVPRYMKRTYLLPLLAAVLCLVSCEQSRIDEPVIDKETTPPVEFFASTDSGNNEVRTSTTKVELGNENSVIWTEKDSVAVFCGSSKVLKYFVKDGYAGRSKTILVRKTEEGWPDEEGSMSGQLEGFSYTHELYPTPVSANVAVYPYSMVRRCSEDNGTFNVGIYVPLRQTLTQGSFGKGQLPIAAVTESLEDSTLVFQNVMGLLQFTIEGDVPLKGMKITGNSQEKLAGEAVIHCSANDTPRIEFSENASTSIELQASKTINLNTNSSQTFYAIIPPADYKEGITVEYKIGSATFSQRYSAINLHRSEIIEIKQNLFYADLCKDVNIPAVSYIDDDFIGVDNEGRVSKIYKRVHDFCREKRIAMDFALINSPQEPHSWVPEGKVNVIRQWYKEGFGFLYHPIHSQGWYNYSPTEPHDVKKVEQSIILAKQCFEFYGLHDPMILVWPGDSNKWNENVEIAKKHFDCGIIASYTGSNHAADNERFQLQRLSLQSIGNGMTKTMFKQKVKKMIENGDWVILGSHIYDLVETDVPDEYTFSTANYFEILEYVNSLCTIRHTEDVWKERQILWEYMDK